MPTNPNEDRRVSQAREAGKAARRATRRIGDNPHRGSSVLVKACNAAWSDGWLEQDKERREAAKAGA